MKDWAKALIILIILLAVGAVVWAMRDEGTGAFPLNNPVIIPGATSTSPTPPPSSTSTAYMIRVTTPLPNALVRSPLTVSGEARGHWYFEASFPVKILDATGKELAIVPAQAQGEWMTTDFVPFSVSIPFATSTTATGFLVLEKDNPSGLPEHTAELRIPIRFR